MPIYCYKCPECGATDEKFCSITKRPKPLPCKKCEVNMVRDIIAEHSGGNVDSQMRDYQFYGEHGTRMYAAAYLGGQEKEMRERHPGREFRWHNSCWLPVIKNRNDKLKYLKERDYVEKN